MNTDEEMLDDGSEDLDQTPTEGAQTGASSADTADAKDGKDDKGPSLHDLQRQIGDLRRSQDELTRTAEYWRGKAEGKAASAEAQDDEDENVALDEDLVDAISSNDAKRVSKALKSMGFVSQKDVDARIQATRGAITRETRLIQEFPDLADESSEFYQATARAYKELIADDPSLTNSPATLKAAAKLAKAELGGSSSAEASRVERVSRQSGGRTVRQSAAKGSDELSPTQRQIIANLRAAGAKIDEESYKKRASGGVRMSGLRRGR